VSNSPAPSECADSDTTGSGVPLLDSSALTARDAGSVEAWQAIRSTIRGLPLAFGIWVPFSAAVDKLE